MFGLMSILTVLPMILLFGAFIFGSVLARRGEKSWRTLLMLIGSITQVLGAVFTAVIQVLLFTSISSSSSSAIADSMMLWGTMSLISTLMILGGMILFAIAFVAYCARAGAASKRAEELEEMLGHLQQRIAGQDGM